MDKVSISANFEGSSAGRNQSKRFDALAEFENLGRQTDGLGGVVSNYTILNRHLGFHLELLSIHQAIGPNKLGQGAPRQTGRPTRIIEPRSAP
ncbi:MAG: hypothetical protein QOE73_313 [Verrucomicrobiota bacterium]